MADGFERKKCSNVFRGTFVHSTSQNAMEIMQDKIVGISLSGKILFIADGESNQGWLGFQYGFTPKDIVFLKPRQFIMPGMVDTHIHAPQYSYTGTGYDQPSVYEWLEKYTYPTEAKFKDLEHARNVYRKAVARLLKNGTTTASYFASMHYEATLTLCDIIVELGQRAYVGICDVDRPHLEHRKSTECCAEETERFIKDVIAMNNPLLTPAVTPRGVALCSKSLMTTHGELAKKYDIPVQGHLREIRNELRNRNYDDFSQTENLAKMCEECGILTEKSYLAHCIYLSEEEIDVMLSHGTGVSHCPGSNFDLKSGVADVRYLLDRKFKVGLGTDVSGGHSPSMLDAIRQCVTASTVVAASKPDSYKTLSYKDAFKLATLGGSEGLSDRIGNFEVGKDFDALFIDPDAEDTPFDCFECDTLEDVIQKFFYLGDDRNILQVYVAGRPVAGRTLISSRFSCKRKPGIDIQFNQDI